MLAGLAGVFISAGCIPSSGPNPNSTTTAVQNSNPFANSASGTSTAVPDCQHYQTSNPFYTYCTTCVQSVLNLFCGGASSSTGCSNSVQDSFTSKVNQCISNTITLGFPCAQSCQAGFALNSSCQCIASGTGTGGGSTNGGTPSNGNGANTNSGPPTSTATLRGNEGFSTLTQSCSFDMSLALQVTNRSLTSPSTNTYTLDVTSVAGGANATYLSSVGPLFYFVDPVLGTNARSTISVNLPSRSSGTILPSTSTPLSLEWIDRYSGQAGASDVPGSASSSSAASTLWGPSIGHVVAFNSGPPNSTSDLYVADTQNSRIRKITTSATPTVTRFAYNPAPTPSPSPTAAGRTKYIYPYGIALTTDGNALQEIFISQWGFNGSAALSPGLPHTGSLAALCVSTDSYSRGGFCSQLAQGCLEFEVNGTYVNRDSRPLGNPCPGSAQDDSTHTHKVIAHQIETPGGIDVFRASDPQNDRVFVALPHKRKLWVMRRGGRTRQQVTGTWNSGTSPTSINFSSDLPNWITQGTQVTVFGSQNCTIPSTPPQNRKRDSLPKEFARETLYYVRDKLNNSLKLSLTPGGPPISFSNTINPGSDTTGTDPCDGTFTSGNMTLAQWIPNAVEYAPTQGFTTPVDVKIDNVSNRAYVLDAGTGILWYTAIHPTTGAPTGVWTQINTLPQTSPQATAALGPDSATRTNGILAYKFVNPLALAIIPNPSGSSNLLIAEGFNSAPATNPGGRRVFVYCSQTANGNDSNIAPLCRNRAEGIYRLAGFSEGDPRASSVANTQFQFGNAAFTSPVGITSTQAGLSSADTDPVYLTAGGQDSGIFRLYPQERTPILGIRYTISDVYNQTAHQCLRFQATRACSSSQCTCRATAPRDITGSLLSELPSLWEEIGPNQACLPE
ncbi:MAG: hypothetical protein ACK5QT_00285 [Oligoflexia bacterium]